MKYCINSAILSKKLTFLEIIENAFVLTKMYYQTETFHENISNFRTFGKVEHFYYKRNLKTGFDGL